MFSHSLRRKIWTRSREVDPYTPAQKHSSKTLSAFPSSWRWPLRCFLCPFRRTLHFAQLCFLLRLYSLQRSEHLWLKVVRMRRHFTSLSGGTALDGRNGFGGWRRRRVGSKDMVVMLCDSTSNISNTDIFGWLGASFPIVHWSCSLQETEFNQSARIHRYGEASKRHLQQHIIHHTSTRRENERLTFCMTSIGSSFFTFKINLASSKLICSWLVMEFLEEPAPTGEESGAPSGLTLKS